MTCLSLILIVLLVVVTSTATQASPSRSLLFGASSSDYIRFELDDSSLARENSICMWIKKLFPAQYGMAWSFKDGSSYDNVGPGQRNRIMGDESLNYNKLATLIDNESIPRGTWYFICYNWRYDRNYKVYLNNKLIATSSGSTGRTRGSGTVVLGNWVNMVTNHAFGSEMMNLNVFSRELSEVEIERLYRGGPCYVDATTDNNRKVKWEDILTYTRNGDVTELTPQCELVLQLNEALENTTTELNQTNDALEQTTAELNETKIMKEALERNVTISCHKEMKTTHWNVLFQDQYLNHVLTEEILASLKSKWDYLDNFVGVNMTSRIIAHFNHHHGNNNVDSKETWAEILGDFKGVTLTDEVIRHLTENHSGDQGPCNENE